MPISLGDILWHRIRTSASHIHWIVQQYSNGATEYLLKRFHIIRLCSVIGIHVWIIERFLTWINREFQSLQSHTLLFKLLTSNVKSSSSIWSFNRSFEAPLAAYVPYLYRRFWPKACLPQALELFNVWLPFIFLFDYST